MNETPDPNPEPDSNLSDLGRALLGGGSGSGASGTRPSGPWIPPSPEQLQALLPQYQILTMLGRGGMGAVYMGKQLSLDRPVAIKILSGALEESDLGFKERFKNEARAMAKLSHPGIVAVHDFGETADGLLYIVMEYIEGTDVARMIAAEGRLHTEYAMAITAHVCDALAYAHERGIIHRDIKPANIMVGYDGVVKVADFGLAKVHSGEDQTLGLTMSGMAMGTMHFMAPEALEHGVTVDHRADLYAVGVMLYQMLTGKVPRGMFEMPSLQMAGLDPRYDGIIAKAMREDREVRYQSARELRADLDGILTQPVEKVEAEDTEPAAALPTMARPKRPGGRVAHRSSGRSTKSTLAKEASRMLMLWVVLGLLALGGGVAWMMRSDKSRTITATDPGEVVPPVKDKSQEEKSVATTPVPAVPETPIPASTASSADGWIELTDGKSLLGWTISGDATWKVENEALTSDSGGNGFLFRELSSPWFELTGEVLAAFDGNGGIHFQASDLIRLNNTYEFQVCGSTAIGKAVGAGGLFDYVRGKDGNITGSQDLLPDGVFTPFRLLLEPDRIQGWMGGTQTVDLKVKLSPESKLLGISRWSGKVAYRNLRLRVPENQTNTDANPRPAVADAPAPPPAKPPVMRKPWPTGRGYRSEGHFRMWSSKPDDSILDLAKLKGVDDVVQVYVNSTGWLVLRENGDLLSGIAGVQDLTDIKRICRGNADEFALVTREGKAIPFPPRTDAANQIPDGLGPVRDVYISSFRQVAILEDGGLVAWGTAHDGIDTRGNGEWKDKPVLPPGRKAVAMSNTPSAMGLRTDDGKILRWGDNGGFGRAQSKFDAPPGIPFAMNNMALYGIPKSDGPILVADWRGNDPATPFPGELQGRDFIGANKSGRNILVLDHDGGIVLDPMCEDRSITAALDFVSLAERDLVSVHLPENNSPVARFLWFDKASSLASAATTVPWEPEVLDGISEVLSRIANYQKARHAQLSELTAKYRTALVAAKDAATKGGILAEVTGVETAITDADAYAGLIEANLTASEVKPLPPLPPASAAAPQRIKELRDIFVGEVAKIESNLVTGLDQSLGTVQTILVQTQKIAEATALETFRSEMMAAFGTSRTSAAVGAPVVKPALDDSPLHKATKKDPYLNSLRMKFVPVPGTKILMCIHETRMRDFEAFADENPTTGEGWKNLTARGVPVTPTEDHPVLDMSWQDGQDFCAWLSKKEAITYRLPTDREWSYAVGIGERESQQPDTSTAALDGGIQDLYPWGSGWPPPKKSGNYADSLWATVFPGMSFIADYEDDHAAAAPVMSYDANELGLYDLGGNAEEWMQDKFDTSHGWRTVRGAAWRHHRPDVMLSSKRHHGNVERSMDFGFRCVIEVPE